MKIEIHYYIRNNGDGSASVMFYESRQEMKEALKQEEEDEYSDPFTDNGESETIEVDENGKILNLDDGSFRSRK